MAAGKEKHLYRYRGPVYRFDDVYERCWSAETWAVSAAKALSQLSYRCKQEEGYYANSCLTLDEDYLCLVR